MFKEAAQQMEIIRVSAHIVVRAAKVGWFENIWGSKWFGRWEDEKVDVAVDQMLIEMCRNQRVVLDGRDGP